MLLQRERLRYSDHPFGISHHPFKFLDLAARVFLMGAATCLNRGRRAALWPWQGWFAHMYHIAGASEAMAHFSPRLLCPEGGGSCKR